MKLFPFALAVAIALSGCTHRPTKHVVAPAGPKTENREAAGANKDAAQSDFDQTRESRDSKAAASLTAIKVATENAATPKEEAAYREASHAYTAFGVTPAGADLQKAVDRIELSLRGLKTQAETAYKAAETESRQLLLDLVEKSKLLEASKAAELKAKEDARLEREDAAKKLTAELDKIRLEHEKQLAELRDGELKFQARTLTCAGVLFAALFGLSAGFGGLAGVKKAWPFLLLAFMSFGLAQIVSQPWFKWAILGATVIGLGGLAYWVWENNKTGKLKEAAEEKAAELKKFASQVVPILDQAYDEAGVEAKLILDSTVFEPLSSKMGDHTKALIHRLRAEAKE